MIGNEVTITDEPGFSFTKTFSKYFKSIVSLVAASYLVACSTLSPVDRVKPTYKQSWFGCKVARVEGKVENKEQEPIIVASAVTLENYTGHDLFLRKDVPVEHKIRDLFMRYREVEPRKLERFVDEYLKAHRQKLAPLDYNPHDLLYRGLIGDRFFEGMRYGRHLPVKDTTAYDEFIVKIAEKPIIITKV